MTISTDDDPREVLAGRLVDGLTGAMETLGVYLGVELGLYRALHDLGEATESEVAGQAGVAPRYAREWLEQQAVAGYLACDDPALPAAQRRYRLPEGHAEVLVDADSPWYVAPLALTLAGAARVLPQLAQAYRGRGGVPYADYGREMRDGIAAANRPMFLHELASAWLPAMPDLDRRLGSAPSRVLDLGCSLGASSVALASAYPLATVLGVDLDEASVAAAGEAAAEAFTAPGDATERLMYGWSILHCLPATLAEDPVEANGTVLRPPTLARWAAEAGFADVEVLAVDNPFWRFYRLRG